MKEIDAFLEHCRDRNYSPCTLRSYAGDLRRFEVFLAQQQLTLPEVKLRDIRSYLAARMEAGYAPASVGRNCETIRSFFTWLRKAHLLEVNPAACLSAVKIPQMLPSFLSEKQAAELMEKPDPTTAEGLRDRAILEVLYGTGIRLNELINLRLDDLQEDSFKVMGKGSKERIVVMGMKAREAIRAYLEVRPMLEAGGSGPRPEVFLSPTGQKMQAKRVDVMIGEYMRSFEGLRQRGAHVLRHSFATHMMNRGADIVSLQALLGHESASSTVRYTHISTQHRKEVYRECFRQERPRTANRKRRQAESASVAASA
jgi:integrase/recombinase XerC